MTTRAELYEELATLLNITTEELPSAFHLEKIVKVLKIGIDADIVARYPDVDPDALSDWLRRYTTSDFYLARTFNKRAHNRHDLDCNDVEPISTSARYRAFKMFQKLKASAPKQEAVP